MRITSGILKNRAITSPASDKVRPTSDKVRAAFFSSIGDEIAGARFLDLFAGTGAVGIEAYSRGAAHVTFVDRHPASVKQNLHLLPASVYTVIGGDSLKVDLNNRYDIIYIDPPYGIYKPAEVLNHIAPFAADGCTVVYELSAREKFDCSLTSFCVIKERKYGDTLLIYLHKEQPHEDSISGDI